MRSGSGGLPELEVGLVDPHPMEHDTELAGERDLGPLGAPPLRDVHRPGLDLRPFRDAGHDYVRGLEQRNPDRGVACSTDGAIAVRLADWYLRGVSPKQAPICLEDRKRSG